MNIRLGAKTKEFNKKLNAATRKIKKFGKSVSNIGKSMSTMFTMPILLAGAASVKMSMEFQKSMTKIQTLVGKTGEEIENMKAGIMEMSTKTAKAPVELAEGLYFLESAGLRGANAMETLEAVAKGSAAGLGDMEALSVVAAAAQNAYGSETLTASDALDKFGVMVRTGMFDAQELSNVLGKQLGLASSLGISFDEVGSVISTYTSTTGDATAATNGLSAIMMTFAKLETKPTANQAMALDQIKMSAEQVKAMIGEQGLVGTMQTLKTKFDENGIAMGSFFTSSQALKGALGVLGSQSEALDSNLVAMGDSAGFVDDAFKVTSETGAFKMEQAMNNLKVAGTQLGDSLAPVVQVISDKILSLTKWWTGLDKSTQDNYASWAIWLATVGPALMIIGKMIVFGGSAIKMFKQWQAVVKLAGGVQLWFNGIVAANPYAIIAMAVIALIAAIVYFATSNSKVAIQVRNAFTGMANIVIGAINYLIGGINKFSKHLGFTIPKVKKWKKEALPAVKDVGDEFGNTSEEVENLTTSIGNVPTSVNTKVSIDVVQKTTKVGSATVGDGEEDAVDRADRIYKIEKKSYENISKLKKQFLVLNAKNEQDAARIKLGQERQAALDGVEATMLGAEEREIIEKTFNKKLEVLLAAQTKQRKAEIENTVSDWEEGFENFKEGFEKVMKAAAGVFNAIGGMMDAQGAKSEMILENSQKAEQKDYDSWYNREMLKIENSKMNEEQKAVAIESLEVIAAEKSKVLADKQDAETAILQKKAAKREKKMKIMSAIMATAQAVVNAIASGVPPPGNFILAGLVAAMGAAQIAAISSTPLPMADGGIAFGPTNALIGEYAGAKNNPEVVAPLDKLKSMLANGNGAGTLQVGITGSLRGDSIVLVSEKTNINRERYI